jgi:hypothetical protein
VHGKKGYEKITAMLRKQLDDLVKQYEDEDAETILRSATVDQKSF